MHAMEMGNMQEWNAIVEEFGAHPMQQWQWGALKEATGPWTATRISLSEGDELVGGAQVLTRSMPFPFRAICYLPRGPFAREGRLMDVANAVADWCKANTKAVSVKIDPAVSELDFGEGWEPSERVLIRKTVVKDLTMDEDTLMKSIPNRKCRQYIRKAKRDGVEVRPGTEADLPGIYALYTKTAEEDGFPIHEEEFYTQAFHLLEGSQQLFVAEQEGDLQAFLWNITSSRGTTFELWGAVSDTGKRSRANYYLKWHAMLAAKELGAVTYDLNGLLNDGISDFKLLFEREPTLWVETHDRPLSPLYHAMNKALEIRRHHNTRDNAQEDTSEE